MGRWIRLSVVFVVVGAWVSVAMPTGAGATSGSAATSQPAATTTATPAASTSTARGGDRRARDFYSSWPKGTGRAAAAAAPNLTIGVDNNTPPGHNWTFTHFFPETNVSVHQGDVVDFHWSAGSPDGLHSVTFFPGSDVAANVTTFRTDNPLVVPDLAGAPPAPEAETPVTLQNNNVFLPQPEPAAGALPCGFGAFAPASTPCVFDNVLPFVSSGALPTGGQPGAPADFQVKISAAPGTYTYVCLIHPKMNGQLTVVAPAAPATTQAQADVAATADYNGLVAGALPKEAAAQTPTFTANPDGSKTWNVLLGLSADDVEILEFLPFSVPITKGDSVKYVNTTTSEIHTASTQTSSPPFGNPECEGVPVSSPDTPAPNPNGVPPYGCPSYASHEVSLDLAPNGVATATPQGVQATIPSGATAASSGVLGGAGSPLPTTATYKFPNNGKFLVFCFIHANMGGFISTPGYRIAGTNGAVKSFGGLDDFGQLNAAALSAAAAANPPVTHLNAPIVGATGSFDEQGYYAVASDGGVFAFGNARFFGSMGGKHLNKPVVGIASTSDGGGYWEVASDGGIFAFGDAQFLGSMGGKPLNKPVVGIAATLDGNGYWEVASDGGIFTFGSATFQGSMGGKPLNKPVVGMASAGFSGYWLATSDGGIFAFGAPFLGSMGARPINSPVVGMQATAGFDGYRLVAADGGIFSFNAPFFGSLGGTALANPVGAIEGT